MHKAATVDSNCGFWDYTLLVTKLPPDRRKRIIDSQRDAWNRYGYHPNALYWSNVEIQTIRFKMLMDIGIDSDDSVLDVGCGFGDFSEYLAKHNKPVRFTGIDLSEELLEEGRKRYSDIKLVSGDLFDFDPEPESYDYVTLSGALNRNLDDDGGYARSVIRRMFNASRKGIAFNLLDKRHEWTAGRWDLQSFYPHDVEGFVAGFGGTFEMLDDYLENDFTVWVRK